MQELIKPGLFWAVRIGLFLSVVVWIVSQWWSCTLLIRGVRAELISYGLTLSYRPPLDAWDLVTATSKGRWKFTVGGSNGEWLFNNWLFGYDVELLPVYSPFVNHENPYRWGVPGLTTAHAYGNRIVAFSYWFLVATFALFYGLLKWVYRKREEEVVCDE